jgi:alpha-tubulin suppressor-like RCC1 family protein
MKRKCGFGSVLFVVVLLTGGCLATDSQIEQPDLPELVTFQAVAVGALHSCGLTLRNIILCWGENSTGQLGMGDDVFRTVPWPVAGGLFFENISAGDGVTCGVTVDGTTYCWGRNEVGQLGDGTMLDRFEPTLVGDGRSFQTVSGRRLGSFGSATCGLGSDGLVYCWGDGQGGQTGTGDPIIATSPIRVYGQAG